MTTLAEFGMQGCICHAAFQSCTSCCCHSINIETAACLKVSTYLSEGLCLHTMSVFLDQYLFSNIFRIRCYVSSDVFRLLQFVILQEATQGHLVGGRGASGYAGRAATVLTDTPHAIQQARDTALTSGGMELTKANSNSRLPHPLAVEAKASAAQASRPVQAQSCNQLDGSQGRGGRIPALHASKANDSSIAA